ncbi:MAG: YopX family protein [Flavobacteriaceae bacterium]|jgi:uncharacterized phage protein (TIGR01671 family)|nr:YopX family protein [Flavobacteriaceae bacterium]
MKRKIKFRGKRNNDNRWTYGGAVGNWNNCTFIIPDDSFSFSCNGSDIDFDVDYVLPETVGQFTGLHDKNGKEIYEHDIVILNEPEPYNYVDCLIKYENATASFCLIALYDDCSIYELYKKGTVMSLYIPIEKIEVIGNIHENKDLLK